MFGRYLSWIALARLAFSLTGLFPVSAVTFSLVFPAWAFPSPNLSCPPRREHYFYKVRVAMLFPFSKICLRFSSRVETCFHVAQFQGFCTLIWLHFSSSLLPLQGSLWSSSSLNGSSDAPCTFLPAQLPSWLLFHVKGFLLFSQPLLCSPLRNSSLKTFKKNLFTTLFPQSKIIVSQILKNCEINFSLVHILVFMSWFKTSFISFVFVRNDYKLDALLKT